ncbi:MAG: hypothetical protein LBK12_00205 [Odoribacteraceae bacterium]|jgi:hypothetical protein|nr:hypothetical protein [Odoribacteraceae bacterium]
MLKRIAIYFLLAAGVSSPVAAQEFNLEYVKRASGWLTSPNAAGLHVLPVRKTSVAELYFNKGDGRFVNYHQSGDRRSWGARTESFFRLHRAVVVHGAIEYENFHGRDMGGSALVDPGYNAFNIVEHADTNRGAKSLERYSLAGAVSVDLYRGLRLGAKIDYKAVNLAKHVDLRHKNTLLDMSLSAGLAYRFNDWLEAGGNYHYRRTIEGVVFNSYGNTDRQYFSLVDFGAFFGRRQLFGESGYTSENRPVFNAFHGASLQLELGRGAASFFNEFTYKSRRGYFGEKSSTAVRYTDHEGSVLEYRGLLSLPARDGLHLVELRAAREKLENHENIYRSETTPGDVSHIVYYGQSKTLDRDDARFSLAYTGQRGRTAGHPAWEWQAAGGYSRRSLTASLYPFFRKQELWGADARLSAGRYLSRGKNTFGLSLGAGGATGGGEARQDGLYAAPSESQPAPATADHLLYREHEYLTLPRLEGNVACTLERPVTGETRGYARVQASYLRALKHARYTGNSFLDVTVSIGCHF